MIPFGWSKQSFKPGDVVTITAEPARSGKPVGRLSSAACQKRFRVPFPDVNSGRWQLSTAGGTRPLWAPSGQELFYVAQTGALMRVGVERGPSWAATAPTLLVKEGYITLAGGNLGRTYDIAPDGQRFLMLKESAGTDQTAAPPRLIVVQHWFEELKRLVPTN